MYNQHELDRLVKQLDDKAEKRNKSKVEYNLEMRKKYLGIGHEERSLEKRILSNGQYLIDSSSEKREMAEVKKVLRQLSNTVSEMSKMW